MASKAYIQIKGINRCKKNNKYNDHTSGAAGYGKYYTKSKANRIVLWPRHLTSCLFGYIVTLSYILARLGGHSGWIQMSTCVYTLNINSQCYGAQDARHSRCGLPMSFFCYGLIMQRLFILGSFLPKAGHKRFVFLAHRIRRSVILFPVLFIFLRLIFMFSFLLFKHRTVLDVIKSILKRLWRVREFNFVSELFLVTGN